MPTESLGYLLLALIAIVGCAYVARAIVIAKVPSLRRQNRRRLLWL